MIGIFDSGIGGLTVVREFKAKFPGLPFIYLGDNARSPYGTRGADVIRGYAAEDVDFLVSQGATIIIIACNTASAQAGDFLKEKYPALKFFEVIEPAARAAWRSDAKRIGVIGTAGTIGSGAYERRLKSFDSESEVFSQACPLFVTLVEQDWADRPETASIAAAYLAGLKLKKLDVLILGCTHYPLIRGVIQSAIGHEVRLIDPAEEVVKSVAEYLSNCDERQMRQLSGGQEAYFATDAGSQFQEVAERWLGEKIEVGLARW